jgi:LPS sulfotransferase NodH
MSLVYLICTSPRSGSTLLCRGLAETGRAGAPAEYFDHREESIAYWRYHFQISTKLEFLDGIVQKTSTPNGIFGTKVHWSTQPDLRQALCNAMGTEISERRDRSLNDLLREKFGAVRYIWLRRSNKVAQGISHFRAARSYVWELPRTPSRLNGIRGDTVRFDFRAIDHCVSLAREYDRQWCVYFESNGLAPLQLVYEDFVAAYDETLRSVLEFLDVYHCDLPVTEPQLERMADAKSLDWEKDYRDIENGRWIGSSPAR